MTKIKTDKFFPWLICGKQQKLITSKIFMTKIFTVENFLIMVNSIVGELGVNWQYMTI